MTLAATRGGACRRVKLLNIICGELATFGYNVRRIHDCGDDTGDTLLHLFRRVTFCIEPGAPVYCAQFREILNLRVRQAFRGFFKVVAPFSRGVWIYLTKNGGGMTRYDWHTDYTTTIAIEARVQK